MFRIPESGLTQPTGNRPLELGFALSIPVLRLFICTILSRQATRWYGVKPYRESFEACAGNDTSGTE